MLQPPHLVYCKHESSVSATLVCGIAVLGDGEFHNAHVSRVYFRDLKRTLRQYVAYRDGEATSVIKLPLLRNAFLLNSEV